MRAGYYSGYETAGTLEARVTALEGDFTAQDAEIAALQAGIVDVYTAHAQGAIAPFAVASGAVVRVNVPALVTGDQFPDDGSLVVTGGLIVYPGAWAGLYEVHCPIAFSTSLGSPVVYTWEVVEGTSLATVPVRRDIATFSVEKQIAASDTSATPTGYLRLRDTGGQIGIFVFHDSGSSATLEATTLSLILQRSRLP